MPTCVKIRGKRRQVCIGDLDKIIAIQSRATANAFDTGEDFAFTTVFSPHAMIETLKNVFVIDEANSTEIEATHGFTIIFPSQTVSGALWVNFNSKRYRIVGQENLDERDEFLRLLCTQRGSDTREAANA